MTTDWIEHDTSFYRARLVTNSQVITYNIVPLINYTI